MPRVIQFSTQSQRSIPNARLALNAPRPLQPIARELAAVGIHLRPGQHGHAWGFSPDTLIARGDDVVSPGDLALRIEPGLMTSRVYEVLAFIPGQGDLAQRVNGSPWTGGGVPYPNFVVFKPYLSFPSTPYLELVESLRYDTYRTGKRFEARFIPVDAEVLAQSLIRQVPRPAAPDKLELPEQPRGKTRREVAVREGGTIFRERVLGAQRIVDGSVECAACHIDDLRILEAAHIVDFGYAEDDWWNGLPMCRNHHRLFDLHVLRLDPTGRWEADGPLVELNVVKPDLSALPHEPATPALRWRYQRATS